MSATTLPAYTLEDVAAHNSEEALWCAIDGKVYDLTDFQDAHPGGRFVLLQVAGQDATTDFYNLHRHAVLERYASLCIGTIAGATSQVVPQPPGALSPVPYAEPAWLVPAFHMPEAYYNASHRRLQAAMRRFTDEHVTPEAQEKEVTGERMSGELLKKMADANIIATRVGPGPHLHGRSILGGVLRGEDFDCFHDLVVNQELVRAAARGFWDGNLIGMVISLTAVLHHAGDAALRDRVAEDCFSGRKGICLAVSEPFAGSDVGNLRTVATLSADGSHYLVNGTKKWITNGVWCDYFVTAVRTGGPGPGGLSVLLVERGPGLETKKIKTSYSAAAGTTLVTFDNVRVPASHLLGAAGDGIHVVLSNFNHERWMVAAAGIRLSRLIVEECLKWSHQRQIFQKRLVDQPVIRAKLATMLAQVESLQAWLEHLTLQMQHLSYAEQARHLAGPIGLLKMHASRCARDIAENAVQVFGGRALTATGMGNLVEMYHRTSGFDAILGGSEDILGDMAVRQASRAFPKAML